MKSIAALSVLLLLVCCNRDDYASVPEKVDGYKLLRIDTGHSLVSTFDFDLLDHRDSFQTCDIPQRISKVGFDTMLVLTYRGIQMVKGNQFLFLNIKGAVSANVSDTNKLLVSSTLGLAEIRIKPDLTPEIIRFKYSKRLDFPEYGCFLYKERNGFLGSSRDRIYIECPDDNGLIMYGWERGQLNKPKCYVN